MKPETIIAKAARILSRHTGPENAIPARQLTREIGLPVSQERTVRRAIKAHIAELWSEHKLPVLSSTRGFFLGNDTEQFQRAFEFSTAVGLSNLAFADAIHRLCKSNGIHLERAK